MKKSTELHTPCGNLRCFDTNKNIIPFEVKSIDKIYKTAVYDEIQSDRVEVVHVCKSICIPARSLKISENYTCRLCGNYKYSYGDTDENAIANVITSGGFSLSLGAYDPNDNGRSKQMVPVFDGGVKIGLKPPEHYDTSEFQGYLLSALPDWSGFSFKMLDHSLPEVLFRIARIKHNEDLVTEISDYENAVTLITIF